MVGGALQHVDHVVRVDVERAGDEGRLGAERDGERPQRPVDRAHRRRVRALAQRRGRRVLALGQTVDLVVVQDDLQVHVAAQDVQDVVAADAQGVAVTGDHPDAELGPGGLEAGGDGRRAAVDAVEAVGVHVVGQAAGAADAGDEDDVLARDAEVGHDALGLGEDRVVAAAGAPAHFLVGDEVLAGQDLNAASLGFLVTIASWLLPLSRPARGSWSSTSEIVNGRPVTRCRPTASTRNLPRMSSMQLAHVVLRDEDLLVAA